MFPLRHVSLDVPKSFRIVVLISSASIVSYLGVSIVVGIALAEIALHPLHRPPVRTVEFAMDADSRSRSEPEDVSLTAIDGAVLRGWYVNPTNSSGSVVILLHGVADNRE